MSIEQRGSAFRAVIRVDGKKVSATFDTRPEAMAWKAAMGAKTAAGKSTVTVGALFEEYLDQVARHTDSAYWNRLRIHKWLSDPIIDIELGEILPHDINQWAARRLQHVSQATVRRELTLMSSAFNYGIKTRRWLHTNPCHAAEKMSKSQPRKPPLLTPEQIKALRIATGYDSDPPLLTKTARVGACFLLALETGMRSGEILRLRPQDYWRDKQTAHVAAIEKGGRKSSRSGKAEHDPSRNVPLTAEAVRLLDQLMLHPGKHHIVGVADSSRDAIWRKCRERSGIDIDLHFHDLKHEAATRLARFLDVFELSHAIGTKDLRLLRDTYYVADAARSAARLPASLLRA